MAIAANGCAPSNPMEQLMSDLVYVGLALSVFVLMSLYARACGRL